MWCIPRNGRELRKRKIYVSIYVGRERELKLPLPRLWLQEKHVIDYKYSLTRHMSTSLYTQTIKLSSINLSLRHYDSFVAITGSVQEFWPGQPAGTKWRTGITIFTVVSTIVSRRRQMTPRLVCVLAHLWNLYTVIVITPYSLLFPRTRGQVLCQVLSVLELCQRTCVLVIWQDRNDGWKNKNESFFFFLFQFLFQWGDWSVCSQVGMTRKFFYHSYKAIIIVNLKPK